MSDEQNRELCSARGERQLVTDRTRARVTALPVAEAAAGKKLYQVRWTQCDRVNANRRIYPREVIQANVDRLKPLLTDGMLSGAVDHEGYLDGGNLRSTCVIWRDLWIEPDGSGVGTFEIVDDHSAGRDLLALVRAGAAIGWSSFGYGSAHDPSDAERARYGLDADTRVVVMDSNYELVAIDAVDRPSVQTTKRRLERTELDPEDVMPPINDEARAATIVAQSDAAREARLESSIGKLRDGLARHAADDALADHPKLKGPLERIAQYAKSRRPKGD